MQWLDNGVAPTLNNIGPCYVGLYNGNNVCLVRLTSSVLASDLRCFRSWCSKSSQSMSQGWLLLVSRCVRARVEPRRRSQV